MMQRRAFLGMMGVSTLSRLRAADAQPM